MRTETKKTNTRKPAYQHNPLYAAYGSNLSLSRMFARCMDAQQIGTCLLADYQLVFKGVADIIPMKGSGVPVGIYRISETDERALDRYEGWQPDNASGLYRKEWFTSTMSDTGETVQVMFYAMNRGKISVPSQHYFDIIAEGYEDWDMPLATLHDALRHAHDAERAFNRKQAQGTRSALTENFTRHFPQSSALAMYTENVDSVENDDPFSERKLTTCRATK